MRLIDADFLLDIVKNKYSDIVAGAYPFNVVVYDLVNIIEEQPTAFDMKNVGWICCSEKLPDKDTWCLATFESGGIDIIQYLSSQKWWNGEMGDNRVIAWIPLPEPYKECER